MGIEASIIDLDGVFDHSPIQPIIINHFDVHSDEDKERINKLVMMEYGTDFIEVEPSCLCGALKGGRYLGVVCPSCATKVSPITERALEPSAWIEVPKGVKAFLNPKVWTILSSYLTYKRFNILEHLVNPITKDPEPTDNNPMANRYLKLNLPRGINHFVDHFEEVIDALVEANLIKKDKDDRLDGTGRVSHLLNFLAMYREVLFCKHLPLPTRLLMIVEKTPMTMFMNRTILPALEAVRIISGLESEEKEYSARSLQSKAMRANKLMAEYSEEFFRTFFDPKKGWLRQHMFGTRSHFTSRAVINSLHEAHDYREIHLPWSLSVELFRLHLISKLLKRGWSVKEAMDHLESHTLTFDPLLDGLFKEMIEEAPGHRIPMLGNRNPSLLRNSLQLLYVTRVKTDVTEQSISISALILRGFNADLEWV